MPDGTQLSRSTSASLLNLPNVITFARLCAVPAAFWLVLENRLDQAFVLFVVAGISDAVDGWLARRYGGNSVGAILDPVADKALLVTMYVTLAAVNQLPDWLAARARQDRSPALLIKASEGVTLSELAEIQSAAVAAGFSVILGAEDPEGGVRP